MASTGELAEWKALGGRVTGRGAAREFVAPTGESAHAPNFLTPHRALSELHMP